MKGKEEKENVNKPSANVGEDNSPKRKCNSLISYAKEII